MKLKELSISIKIHHLLLLFVVSFFVISLFTSLHPKNSNGSGLSLSPATITTGLRWSDADGNSSDLYPYSGTTVSASDLDCANGNPCTWSLIDGNGTIVDSLSTGGGTTAAGRFGQIDCTGSASNASCVYDAPFEYPPGAGVTISVSDGTDSGTTAVDFVFSYNLQEYWTHHARMLGINAKPDSDLVVGVSPTRYQPELLTFESTSTPGVHEVQLLQNDNDSVGAEFPVTGGSGINRPSWSYNGKWFTWATYRCVSGSFCSLGQQGIYIAQTDGSNLQSLASRPSDPVPESSSFTYAYDNPNLIFAADDAHLYAVNMNTDTQTTIATYSSSSTRTIYSPPTGSTLELKDANPASPCTPGVGCSPNVYFYNVADCENELSTDCATLSSQWSTYLNLNFGWDVQGLGHCAELDGTSTSTANSDCEYHQHDFYLRRGTTDSIWNYGPKGDVGEGIFYDHTATGTTTEFYPNASSDVPYMSHPAFDWTGNLVSYGGAETCSANSDRQCTDGVGGEGIWNMSEGRTVAFTAGISYGHAAWDGFDDTLLAHDGYGGGTCPLSDWCLDSSFVNYSAGTVDDTTILDFGVRNRNNITGDAAFGLLLSPTQSPDATKIAESIPNSFSVEDSFQGWIAAVRTPDPPINVSLATTTSAQIGWFAAPLNYETENYNIYKQPSCTGAWSLFAAVPANYLQSSQYTYSDVDLSSGTSACYGLTSEEWGGMESNILSNVIQITNTSGTFSGVDENASGTTGFDITAPGTVSGVSADLERITTPGKINGWSQGTGGSLADGTYWVRMAFCNFTDYPADTQTNARCTPAGPAQTIKISAGGGTASLADLTIPTDGVYGETGVQVYVGESSTTEPIEMLQTCSGASSTYVLPWNPRNATSSAGFGDIDCTINALATSTSVSPSDNQTAIGYTLHWTPPSDSDVRYYEIYSRDDASPALSTETEYEAQQYMIATMPASSTSYLDYTPNWTRIYRGSDGPYYGIVAVDHEGNRSAPICVNAATGNTVACDGKSYAVPDTTPPTVALTAPTDGSTASGRVIITADASDNVGVASVQFTLDGNDLGSAVSAAPYQVFWNSVGATDGLHILSVSASDAAGNVTTSTAITVNVSNNVSSSASPSLVIVSSGGGGGGYIPPVSSQTLPPPAEAPASSSSVSSKYSNQELALRLTKNLAFGEADQEVSTLQIFLNKNNFPLASQGAGSRGEETDYFGSRTETALIKFQKEYNVPATGFFGPLTRTSIDMLAGIVPSSSLATIAPKPPLLIPSIAFRSPLGLGSSGPEVRALQQLLIEDGDYPSGIVSGYFGLLTENAIKLFQSKYGILSYGTPSLNGFGVVGPKTLAKLNTLETAAVSS